MTGTDVRWTGVEVVVSRQPNDPDGFRVAFERAGPEGTAKLAMVYVDGGEDAEVTRFVPAAGVPAAGPNRAEYERKAVAVVRAVAETLPRD
jgi:hypothetical protein